MNREETLEKIKRAQAGDGDAKQELVEENAPLVWSIVKRFTGRGCETEDLYQLGCIGLIRSIDQFDTSFGTAFSTYAVPLIMGEIKRFLRDDGAVKVSRSLKETAAKAKAVSARLGEEATLGQIARELDLPVEEIAAALTAATPPQSLYTPVYGAGSEHETLLLDTVGEEKCFDEEVINHLALRQAAQQLPQREKMILQLRYFAHKTQSEVAQRLGISQVQVSRIEKKILEKLRALIA